MIVKNVETKETKGHGRTKGLLFGLLVAFITFCVSSVFILQFGNIHLEGSWPSELAYVIAAATRALPVAFIAGVISYIVVAWRSRKKEAEEDSS